jgi:short-subunit dehydrogenase
MQVWIAEADQKTPLDLVIANAGISGGSGAGGETAAQVRELFAVNLHGVLNTVLPALGLMSARGRGQIALMASLAGFNGWPGAPAYGASKGAVRLYGEALRGAMAGSGVQVNVICPGFVRSPMTDVNNYPMPFLMNTEKAARIIARGLSKNRGRIAFPGATYILTGCVASLPFFLMEKILKNTPRKNPIPKN